jgi:hypothetical protein
MPIAHCLNGSPLSWSRRICRTLHSDAPTKRTIFGMTARWQSSTDRLGLRACDAVVRHSPPERRFGGCSRWLSASLTAMLSLGATPILAAGA